MKTTEMKHILYNKLMDENTGFKLSDISINKTGNNKYMIVIREYEHIPFKMEMEIDDYFGNVVTIWDEFNNDFVAWCDGHCEFDKLINYALLQLGYTIGNTF